MEKSWIDRLWLRTQTWSITLEGTLTWWCSDDVHYRERRLDVELRLPQWVWRPLCALRGEHEDYYGSCLYCGQPTGLRRALKEQNDRMRALDLEED